MGRRITDIRPSTAFPTVDLDGPGKQVGFVMFPHSPDDDAWGATRVPIAVIANGNGPTVILEGGNHGDEYEGPIVIGELIRDLDPGAIEGRLILMESRVPDYPSPERAVTVVQAMCEYSAWLRRPPRVVTRFPVNRRRVERIIRRHLRTGELYVGEAAAKEVVEAYDFETPPGAVADSADQAIEVAVCHGVIQVAEHQRKSCFIGALG